MDPYILFAVLLGLVAGGISGTYLNLLWRPENPSSDEDSPGKKWSKSLGLVTGFGGVPNVGWLFEVIHDQLIWYLILYVALLVLPTILIYINSFRHRLTWQP